MQFRPNTPAVVAETVNGETIIMHHRTGSYYDGSGSAALLWTAIESGADAHSLAEILLRTYEIRDEVARSAVDQFLAFLVMHNLVTEHPGSPAPLSFQGRQEQRPFSMPEFSVHTDLADMLLLDPIHDVDEAGWPAPKRALAAGE
jgi:hypothetical protein